jgi:putative chitinase
MTEFKIDNFARQTAFIAQICHETGEFKYLRELWGPTVQQKKYEPPSKLADQLGNTKEGDGKLFRGRGAIQLTGRANYKKYGAALGFDLESNPELASSYLLAFRIAGLFWKDHGLNELADQGNFMAITKKINGGYNGQDEREKYLKRAKEFMK